MDTISYDPLPTKGNFAEVHCLDGGSFIGNWAMIHADVHDEYFRMYNWAFHIHDKITDRHVLWDVGMSSEPKKYSPFNQRFMADIKCTGPRQDLEVQLMRRNIRVEDIDSVIFSHAHWDHCRPIKDEFPEAKLYFGPGTRDACAPGHFDDPENVQWDGRIFHPTRATDPYEELKGPWVKFGSFERAMDYFGTGSFWIIQAPGHMPGNLCAAVRQSQDEWILLGSDCCHSRALLDGKHEIATWKLPNGCTQSLQADVPAAKDTLARVRIMESVLGCNLALAHDTTWMKAGTNHVLMNMLDDELREAVRTRLPNDEVM